MHAVCLSAAKSPPGWNLRRSVSYEWFVSLKSVINQTDYEEVPVDNKDQHPLSQR